MCVFSIIYLDSVRKSNLISKMPLVSILKPYTLYIPKKQSTQQRKVLVIALGTALSIAIILAWIAFSTVEI